MSTKYLRKIVLEEIQNVLKEYAPTAVGARSRIAAKKREEVKDDTTQDADASYNVDTRGDVIPAPDLQATFPPKKVAPKFSPMQIAVMNLQKQLRRLGATETYKGKIGPLRSDGKIGDNTLGALALSGIRPLGLEIEKSLSTPSSIRKLTQELSRMTPEQYQYAKSQFKQDQASVAPKSEPDVQISPSTEEERRKREEAKEKAEKLAKERGFDINLQESLIRKEITKLLKKL